jgi:hypothetical protein
LGVKRWQIAATAVLLAAVLILGWAAQEELNSYSHSGSQGFGVGRNTNEVMNQYVSTQDGTYVSYEVDSPTGAPLNVYFTDLQGLMDLRQNGTFGRAPLTSMTNVTHTSANVRLDPSQSVWQIVITSTDPNLTVPFVVSVTQGQFPLDYRPLFGVLQFGCWIGSLSLFFLLVYAYGDCRGGARAQRK